MSIIIDIIGSFTGKKSFNDAENAISKLTKSAAKLGATIGVARLAQQSMLNYMADEKATKVLAQNLRNLGLAYNQVGAEQFIQTMQAQTGVLDDQLRPAYAQLARVTGSVSKTQELLKLAFDVSAGSGQDYASVVDALSQAYVGNNRGLKSLNIGLTQAELQSKSFAEIQKIIGSEFAGAGAASLDTYAGKMAILQAHVADASETIGKSLLDALTNASGSNGFGEFISKLDTAAGKIADLITYAGRGAYTLENLFNPKKLAAAQKQYQIQDTVKMQQRAGMHEWQPSGAYTPEQKKAEAAAKKRNAEILAQSKAQNKLSLNNLKLQKAAAVFDMKKIQITAALKSATDKETVTRLELMLAIENQQGDLADKLQKKLDEIQAKNKQLTADLTNLQSLNPNPYGLAEASAKNLVDYGGHIIGSAVDLANLKGNPFVDMLNSLNEMARVLPDILDKSGQLTGRGLHNIPSLTDAGVGTVNIPLAPVAPVTPVVNNITVQGAVDPVSTANQIGQILAGAAGSTGSYTGLGYSWLQALGLTP